MNLTAELFIDSKYQKKQIKELHGHPHKMPIGKSILPEIQFYPIKILNICFKLIFDMFSSKEGGSNIGGTT